MVMEEVMDAGVAMVPWMEDDGEEMDTSQDEDADLDMTPESRKRDGTEVGGTGRVSQQVNLLEHTPQLDTPQLSVEGAGEEMSV